MQVPIHTTLFCVFMTSSKSLKDLTYTLRCRLRSPHISTYDFPLPLHAISHTTKLTHLEGSLSSQISCKSQNLNKSILP
jgi:hypothetical protein